MSDRTNPPRGAGSTQPPSPAPSGAPQNVSNGVHAMRRGGARHEVTERVKLSSEDGRSFEGWALNVSRGGLRAILEDRVILGAKFEVDLGSDVVVRKSGRVVWVQEEPDGVIVGLEFTGQAGHPSVPPAPPGSQRVPSFPVSSVPEILPGAEEDEDPGTG